MTPKKLKGYKLYVIWSEEDQEWVGLIEGENMQYLSWLAPTPEEAMDGIEQVLLEVLEDMKND